MKPISTKVVPMKKIPKAIRFTKPTELMKLSNATEAKTTEIE